MKRKLITGLMALVMLIGVAAANTSAVYASDTKTDGTVIVYGPQDPPIGEIIIINGPQDPPIGE